MGEGSVDTAAIAVQTSRPPLEDRQLVKWIAEQKPEEQTRIATECMKHFLDEAAQPRNASSNACIKLCYFLDQCKASSSSTLQLFAFQEQTCLDLFKFYIEWNEKNQHRSMRQVLEVISSLIARNPQAELAHSLKKTIIERTMQIVSHQAALPLVKPAFKCLEYLVGKGTIPVYALIWASPNGTTTNERTAVSKEALKLDKDEMSWDQFFNGIFEWMSHADISPAAGKFLVTAFLALKRTQTTTSMGTKGRHSISWQRWISNGLVKDPGCLENVKNYLFAPLFKLDRAGSLVFLQDINTSMVRQDNRSRLDEEANQLLRLSALETGKKAGLVEEPLTLHQLNTTKKATSTISLVEDSLKPLVLHSSDTVRSLAFSVLVSSLSTIRPYTRVALKILKSCMAVMYLDSDAKFRNDVLSNTKHMIERLRGATSFIAREIQNLSYRPGIDKMDEDAKKEQGIQREEIDTLFHAHKDFLNWYLDFLLQELVPAASYQRHITSLKAILILLRSGINGQKQESARSSGNATSWPFSIHFFSPSTVKVLLGLLLDPFEDVRTVSAAILKLTSRGDFSERKFLDAATALHSSGIAMTAPRVEGYDEPLTNLEGGMVSNEIRAEKGRESSQVKRAAGMPRELGVLLDFIDHARILSKQTGRADYADGFARAFELLCFLEPSVQSRYELIWQLVEELEKKVESAENNLGQAVLGAPIHGDFAALRLVWDCFLAQTAPGSFSDLRPIEPPFDHTAQTHFSVPSSIASISDLNTNIQQLELHSQSDFDQPSDIGTQASFTQDQEVTTLLSRKSQIQQPARLGFETEPDLKLSLTYTNPNPPKLNPFNLSSPPPANLLLTILQQRIISACLRIWNAVKDILCNDSPEGLVPEDLEENNTVDTKNVLSYSFRAIHESSNLLRSIASKIDISLTDKSALLSFELFEQIGDLTFDQLSHLRHRGAFSTVSLTFAKCCIITQHRGAGVQMAAKLNEWRVAAMDCINTIESTTRRSGGIPVLMTGIMAATPGKERIHEIMVALTEIANTPLPESEEEITQLPQVHAMNCLREAFKSSTLNVFCEGHIGPCLELAVTSLKSEVYSIRNCGLLLLRSIIDTLFGTSTSKSEIEDGWDGKSVRIHYDKCPELIAILEELLQAKGGSGDSQTEMVMAALYILHRAGPPAQDPAGFIEKVRHQLRNHLWLVREMAARTLCALTMGDDLTFLIPQLLGGPTDETNFLHGCLLASRFILQRRMSRDPVDFDVLLNSLQNLIHTEQNIGLERPIIQVELVRLTNTLYMAVFDSSTTISHEPTRALSENVFSELTNAIAEPHTNKPLILALVQQGIILAALKKDFEKLFQFVDIGTVFLDEDAGLELVGTLTEVFGSKENMAFEAKVYEHLLQYFTSPDVLAVVLDHFCNSLENFGEKLSLYTSQGIRDSVRSLGIVLHRIIFHSPAMTQAFIRFTGCMMHARIANTQFVQGASREFVQMLPDWQALVKNLTQDEHVFELRLAAAKSLSFGLQGFDHNSPPSEISVSAFFTLFDVLSDDDEEIRGIGADTVAYFSGFLLVPLAAGEWLAKEYMPLHFRDQEDFTADVKRRAASLGAAVEQRDDRLFAVEKSNLYRDEDRDRELWGVVLAGL